MNGAIASAHRHFAMMETPMSRLDLSANGKSFAVDLTRTVEQCRVGAGWPVFLFGEYHSDRAMKKGNVLDACRLIDAGIVGFVGTEMPMADLDRLGPDEIQARSADLLGTHGGDEAVMDYLSRVQPWWYGFLQFGSTLRLLRPSVPVACVEDPELREKMKPISDAYELADFGCGAHPCPDYPDMIDHPHNRLREAAMIDNLLALWARYSPDRAAILNTGIGHCGPIAESLQKRGIGYYLITRPRSS
jgi:hypothetical protein